MSTRKFWSVQYTLPSGSREEVVIEADSFCAEGGSVDLFRSGELIAHVNCVSVVLEAHPSLIDERSPEVPEELTP